ncbi:MAG: phage major capsid protein [Methanobrevibacter sp.]|uniref:SU10 major capsid protein n=1 Tax=Methanobrevibacter sp. TaxID=66852 RepID=UPI0026DFE686|nr:phage major capsid protein [Methanobrevibacter sp.]MDO5849304.1 phage major capsid protein [Methanobrevibacter sp.]
MTDLKIEEVVKQVAVNSAEIEALQKTMQTTSNYPDAMQIEYSTVLQSKTFEKAPFLRYLESKGQVLDNKAALVGYFEEKREEESDVKWIDESDEIPDANAETILPVLNKMRTIVAPIEVSMMAQLGNQAINVLKRRQDQKFIEINNKTDTAILEGSGNTNKDFKGITTTIKTHTEDLQGEKITEAIIDDMLEELHNDNGNPDVMVCSYNVAKQLKDMIKPNQRNFLDKVDIGLGHRVISYFSLEGTEMPILVDRNFDTTDGGKMAIIDSSTIEVRRLMPPTLIPNIPVNKLATKDVIAAFLTTQNTGEFKDGLITGIGDGTPSS